MYYVFISEDLKPCWTVYSFLSWQNQWFPLAIFAEKVFSGLVSSRLLQIYMHVYTYICIYIYMYVYTYVYINIYVWKTLHFVASTWMYIVFSKGEKVMNISGSFFVLLFCVTSSVSHTSTIVQNSHGHLFTIRADWVMLLNFRKVCVCVYRYMYIFLSMNKKQCTIHTSWWM